MESDQDLAATRNKQLHKKTFDYTRGVQKSIDEYEAASKHESSIQKPVCKRWMQDTADLKALNRETLGVSARIINEFVIPKAHTSLSKPSEKSCEIEMMAWELMDEGMPTAREGTWGRVAQGLVTAFTTVSRLVSSRNEEPQV